MTAATFSRVLTLTPGSSLTTRETVFRDTPAISATTSTMAFYRAGYSVGFLPITVDRRQGSSHINLLRDGLRFLLIIFKIGTLYSPLKVYFPFAVVTAGLGIFNYVATSVMQGSWRFTNMSALLISSGVIIFLLGLLSEQLTNLQYKDVSVDDDPDASS